MTAHVTAAELCERSGLTPAALFEVEDAGLLLPDEGDPSSYRPRLVGWARKLAYLLGEGWTLEEIRRWADGRWSTPNPRQWPPQRHEWRPHGSQTTPRMDTPMQSGNSQGSVFRSLKGQEV